MSLATDQNIEERAFSTSAVPFMFSRDAARERLNGEGKALVAVAGDLPSPGLVSAFSAAHDDAAEVLSSVHLERDGANVSPAHHGEHAKHTSFAPEQPAYQPWSCPAAAGHEAKERLVNVESRRDEQMANAVSRGLEIDAVHGSVAAWTHMVANGIAVDTIARVLTSARRRVGDPPFLTGPPRG